MANDKSYLQKLIDDASEVVGSECNSTTPEFRALELLLNCVEEIEWRLQQIEDFYF